MVWLRSFVFNIVFYGWGLFCTSVFLPVLILPRPYVLWVTKFWIRGVIWICENVLRLQINIIGLEKLPNKPMILAAKHQSTWETLIFHHFFADPTVVLKQELLWIPLFGWYLKKLRSIPLSRSKRGGAKDLKILLKKAEQVVAQGQPILIFPEGTRSHPEQKGTYHSGVARLYQHLKIPVIPIAHNAGLFWPRRGFVKYPGCITLEFLDPIEPGLPRQEFMRILEDKIESETNNLVREGMAYAPKS
jgi:1-acyl-sn-glycerol-3-phosphate acyltransferase